MKRGLFWLAFGGAATVTILACWGAWIFMIQPMDEAVKTANKIERAFATGFEISPRISANAGVLFAQSARADHLVFARREVLVEIPIDTPLADGSQPRVKADFLAEAGITGREAIEINIRRGGRSADVVLPKVKILELEPQAEPSVAGRDWNSLPEGVRNRALRQLRLAARKDALESGLLREADAEFRRRLQGLADQAGCALVFQNPNSP
jgi:hypothetical protein